MQGDPLVSNAAPADPKQTLYVHNLHHKIRKEELRRSLYELFSQYGRVLDVVALKTDAMRGQAFIVFPDINTASSALRGLDDTLFYGRKLQIQYAKETSFVVDPSAVAKREQNRLTKFTSASTTQQQPPTVD